MIASFEGRKADWKEFKQIGVFTMLHIYTRTDYVSQAYIVAEAGGSLTERLPLSWAPLDAQQLNTPVLPRRLLLLCCCGSRRTAKPAPAR